jgi:FkbM family methyltransferase
LFENRNCSISTDCVWAESGKKMKFLESIQPELSTLLSFSEIDGRQREKACDAYEVETISLVDLLRKFNAPATIDFMSIDTEGSEFEILNNFDWSAYKINALCIEHNYTNSRKKIYELLSDSGYFRVYEGISGADDWYVKK